MSRKRRWHALAQYPPLPIDAFLTSYLRNRFEAAGVIRHDHVFFRKRAKSGAHRGWIPEYRKLPQGEKSLKISSILCASRCVSSPHIGRYKTRSPLRSG